MDASENGADEHADGGHGQLKDPQAQRRPWARPKAMTRREQRANAEAGRRSGAARPAPEARKARTAEAARCWGR